MPVIDQLADTITQAAASESYYAPQYMSGFPDTVPGDSVLGSINTLPVMEQLPGQDALPFLHSPLHDTPSMALLIAGLLFVTLSYHTGYKYISNLWHYMFSTRRRENLFEDRTLNETTILAALLVNTCIVGGFIIYMAVQLLRPDLAPSPQANVFLHIGAFTLMTALFLAVQWLVYKVLGYTFSDKVGSRLWLDGFKATQSLVGLLLLPVLLLLLFYPAHGKLLLTIAAVLYLIARLIFIIKGARIFYSNLSSILYFLLYLCAVEIVPLVIMTGLTIWLCGILSI